MWSKGVVCMSYAIYVLEVELSRISKELRSYKRAIDNGELLNHELDVELYEKRIKELKTVIKDLKSH